MVVQNQDQLVCDQFEARLKHNGSIEQSASESESEI
mgnify:CR=1 FL=1